MRLLRDARTTARSHRALARGGSASAAERELFSTTRSTFTAREPINILILQLKAEGAPLLLVCYFRVDKPVDSIMELRGMGRRNLMIRPLDHVERHVLALPVVKRMVVNPKFLYTISQ